MGLEALLRGELRFLYPAVKAELPKAVDRAIAAGATPPLTYIGAGAYGIVLEDSAGLCFKVQRVGETTWQEWVASSPYLRQSAVDEAEWFAAAWESPTLRPYVPKPVRFDDQNGVFIRECVSGRPGTWADESALSALHSRLEKASIPEIGWTMPEFKGDSWVLDEKDGNWKIIDGSMVMRVGSTLVKHIEDFLEGRIALYTRPEDLAFFLRRESEWTNPTVPKEVAAPLLKQLEARKTAEVKPANGGGHRVPTNGNGVDPELVVRGRTYSSMWLAEGLRQWLCNGYDHLWALEHARQRGWDELVAEIEAEDPPRAEFWRKHITKADLKAYEDEVVRPSQEAYRKRPEHRLYRGLKITSDELCGLLDALRERRLVTPQKFQNLTSWTYNYEMAETFAWPRKAQSGIFVDVKESKYGIILVADVDPDEVAMHNEPLGLGAYEAEVVVAGMPRKIAWDDSVVMRGRGGKSWKLRDLKDEKIAAFAEDCRRWAERKGRNGHGPFVLPVMERMAEPDAACPLPGGNGAARPLERRIRWNVRDSGGRTVALADVRASGELAEITCAFRHKFQDVLLYGSMVSEGVGTDVDLMAVQREYAGVKQSPEDVAESFRCAIDSLKDKGWTAAGVEGAPNRHFITSPGGVVFDVRTAGPEDVLPGHPTETLSCLAEVRETSTNGDGAALEADPVPPQGITIRNDVRDYYSGQLVGTLRARDETDRVVGYLDWSYYDHEPYIDMVEVNPAFRRRGIGLALVSQLVKEFPGTIHWQTYTEEGGALRDAWERTHPPSNGNGAAKPEFRVDPKHRYFQTHPNAQLPARLAPLEFLDLADPTWRYTDWKSERSIDYLRGVMERGDVFEPPYLDVNPDDCRVTGHEGRHRAWVAHLYGIEKIPVILFFRNERGDYVDPRKRPGPVCGSRQRPLRPALTEIESRSIFAAGFHSVPEAREAYRQSLMTPEQVRAWEFPHVGSGSRTPKNVFSWPRSENETLYDLGQMKDDWRLKNALGEGYERSWEPMTGLIPVIRGNEPIWIFRASDVGPIIPGSYVSESEEYATLHGERSIPKGSKWHIYGMTAKPSELVTLGDPHEFIYVPESVDRWLEVARKRVQYFPESLQRRFAEEVGATARGTNGSNGNNGAGAVPLRDALKAAGLPEDLVPVSTLAELFTGGRWILRGTAVERMFVNPGELYEIAIDSPHIPGLVEYHRKIGDFIDPDPRFYDPRIATLDAETVTRIKEGIGYSQDVPEKEEEATMYRGISSEEMKSVLATGQIRSLGEYNIGESEVGMTLFAPDPPTAQLYAASFQPYPFIPNFTHPAYVLKVRRPPGIALDEHGNIPVPGAVPVGDVLEVFEGEVYDFNPGYVQLTRAALRDGRTIYTEGSRSSPSSRIAWRRTTFDAVADRLNIKRGSGGAVPQPAALPSGWESKLESLPCHVTMDWFLDGIRRDGLVPDALGRIYYWPGCDADPPAVDEVAEERWIEHFGREPDRVEELPRLRTLVIGIDPSLVDQENDPTDPGVFSGMAAYRKFSSPIPPESLFLWDDDTKRWKPLAEYDRTGNGTHKNGHGVPVGEAEPMAHTENGKNGSNGHIKFVVGCPHAYCTAELHNDIEKGEGHMCDAITGSICTVLGNVLGATVFKAPRPRAEGDMNRDTTLAEPWRKALEEAIDKHTVYLDIHSFPRWDSEWGVYDFVILTEPACPSWLNDQVRQGLQRAGYKIGVYSGRFNSLIKRACELGAKGSLLLETNEKFMQTSGGADMVANAIAGVLQSVNPPT